MAKYKKFTEEPSWKDYIRDYKGPIVYSGQPFVHEGVTRIVPRGMMFLPKFDDEPASLVVARNGEVVPIEEVPEAKKDQTPKRRKQAAPEDESSKRRKQAAPPVKKLESPSKPSASSSSKDGADEDESSNNSLFGGIMKRLGGGVAATIATDSTLPLLAGIGGAAALPVKKAFGAGKDAISKFLYKKFGDKQPEAPAPAPGTADKVGSNYVSEKQFGEFSTKLMKYVNDEIDREVKRKAALERSYELQHEGDLESKATDKEAPGTAVRDTTAGKKKQSGLFKGMLVDAGLAALVGVVTEIIKYEEQLKKFFDEFGNAIQDAIVAIAAITGIGMLKKLMDGGSSGPSIDKPLEKAGEAAKGASEKAGESAAKGAASKAGESAAKGAAEKAGESAAKGAASHAAEEVVEKKVAGTAVKGIAQKAERSVIKGLVAKMVPAAMGKLAAKALPFGLGALTGTVFGAWDWMKGDKVGAAMDVAAGAAAAIPAVGTAASIMITVAQIARDIYNELYKTPEDPFPFDSDVKNNPALLKERSADITKEVKDTVISYFKKAEKTPEETKESSGANKSVNGVDVALPPRPSKSEPSESDRGSSEPAASPSTAAPDPTPSPKANPQPTPGSSQPQSAVTPPKDIDPQTSASGLSDSTSLISKAQNSVGGNGGKPIVLPPQSLVGNAIPVPQAVVQKGSSGGGSTASDSIRARPSDPTLIDAIKNTSFSTRPGMITSGA